MEAFIVALVHALPSFLRPLATPVASRILRVWRWSDGLARRIKVGYVRVILGAARLRDGMQRLGSEAATTLTWLVRVRIPAAVGAVRAQLVRWVSDRIRALQSALTMALDGLRRWLAERLGDALESLAGLRRWVTGIIAPILDTVRGLVRHVLGPLGSPDRLAAWAVGAIWRALWRLLRDRIDEIAELFWRARRAVLLRTLAEAERILGRIL